MQPFNRALHPADYANFGNQLALLRSYESQFQAKRLFYRKDHIHREWEYAQILHQLESLYSNEFLNSDIKILDTGSGCSYFVPILKMLGYDITTSDSEAYGPVTEKLREQCFAFDIRIPLYIAPVENLSGIEDKSFNVTMCISVIEHLSTDAFAKGLQELYRVTKPGGYIFITSDYFENWERARTSPSLAIQHNLFYPHTSEKMINDVIDVNWIGGVDLTYRGDFVNGHSFVNFCLQRKQ